MRLLCELLGGLECTFQAHLHFRVKAFWLTQTEVAKGAVIEHLQLAHQRVAALTDGRTVIRGRDGHMGGQLWVLQARADARVQLFKALITGHHHGQAAYIAVINDLKQFFFRPGGGILGSQVVQHQQVHIA
ncbi:hypothetical protein SDC9_88023 [bioreactor metagenome]|uniref:Uncharacterized protein n=1 Tax=bioreactor metagenome TaxID=1076179 RepID=A0A644ZLX6_9ZZZZ